MNLHGTGCLPLIAQVEETSLQRQALALMPLSDIRQEATAAVELDLLLSGSSAAASTRSGADDLVVQGLLHWFKHKFFKWVGDRMVCLCQVVSLLTNFFLIELLQEQQVPVLEQYA